MKEHFLSDSAGVGYQIQISDNIQELSPVDPQVFTVHTRGNKILGISSNHLSVESLTSETLFGFIRQQVEQSGLLGDVTDQQNKPIYVKVM